MIGIGDPIAKIDGAWGHLSCSMQPDLSLAGELPEAQHSRRTITYRMPKSEPETVMAFNTGTATPTGSTPLAMLDELTNESIPEITTDFTPSNYQAAIYEWLKRGTGHAVVLAGPGTGKSTTLRHAAPYLPEGKRIAAIAFNKKIAKELERIMPTWIECSTFHSLGFKNILRAFGKGVRMEERKVWKILDEIFDAANYETREAIESDGAIIVKLVSLMKNTLSDDLDLLASHYGVVTNGNEAIVFEVARQVFHHSLEQARQWIDFDDMIYLCATDKAACSKFDFLLVDEFQDLNRAQIEMLLRSLIPGGRVLAVGDRRQSCYGFRGADTEAIDRIIRVLSAVTMPLNLSYRLPTSHVEMLNQKFPDQLLETRPDAPQGEIVTLPESALAARVHPGDMVICRTNAPLVEPCFALIREGIKAVIVGRDIGKGLAILLDKAHRKSGADNLRGVLAWLNEWAGREAARLVERNKNTQAATLLDQVATLDALSAECQTVSEVKARIESVFSDEAEGVVFSSVHRAKGLEAESVYLLHPELIPHPMCKQPWEIAQEQNILFVALSRSKHSLYFVTPEAK